VPREEKTPAHPSVASWLVRGTMSASSTRRRRGQSATVFLASIGYAASLPLQDRIIGHTDDESRVRRSASRARA
jgi:hypothetical protein